MRIFNSRSGRSLDPDDFVTAFLEVREGLDDDLLVQAGFQRSQSSILFAVKELGDGGMHLCGDLCDSGVEGRLALDAPQDLVGDGFRRFHLPSTSAGWTRRAEELRQALARALAGHFDEPQLR